MRITAVSALLAAAALVADGPRSNAAPATTGFTVAPHQSPRLAKLHIRSATATLTCPGDFFVTADVVNTGIGASSAGIVVEFCPAPPGVDAWVGHMTSPMTSVYGLSSLAPGASVTTMRLSMGAWLSQPVSFAGRSLSFSCCTSIPVEVKLFQYSAGAPGALAVSPEWDRQVFTVTAAPAANCTERSPVRLHAPALEPTIRPVVH